MILALKHATSLVSSLESIIIHSVAKTVVYVGWNLGLCTRALTAHAHADAEVQGHPDRALVPWIHVPLELHALPTRVPSRIERH